MTIKQAHFDIDTDSTDPRENGYVQLKLRNTYAMEEGEFAVVTTKGTYPNSPAPDVEMFDMLSEAEAEYNSRLIKLRSDESLIES